jgi:hypothetical protein
MRRTSGILALVMGVAALCLYTFGGPAGASEVPNTDWSAYLPALPSPAQTKPNRVAHCKEPRLKCVRVEIARLRALRDQLGCDHRAVFATTYMELTKGLKRTVKADRGFFRWPHFFYREDALFANVYFRTMKRWNRGQEVPEAWQVALETAQDGEVYGAQDLLLGINAHVQNDMPFVLAQLGLRDRAGNARKPDHDAVNQVLNDSYEPVIEAVKRYDASISLTNPQGVPADDLAGLELVREWREQVWHNAERLINAKSDAERAQVAHEIQDYAGQYAQGIAANQVPGYRATRDAHCAANVGG